MSKFRVVLKHLAFAVLHVVVFAVLAGGWLYIDLAQSQADLRLWHTVELEGEYRGRHDSRVTDYASYVALEDELFDELRREVYEGGDPTVTLPWSRYKSGGLHDPSTTDHAWNRSMELVVERPVGGALLLHGSTDSPYSMRALAERLHAQGWHVVVPRYPGHGTAPAGLNQFRWRDLVEVAALAQTHLRERVGPDAPLIAVGYSTGGTLAIELALAHLEGETDVSFDRIVTLSPALGLTPVAALAKTQLRFSVLLGIPKLAWTGIEPEYDPYKYNSFSVNAGDQVYRLTERVNERVARLQDSAGIVHGLPPILSFASTVDATVNVRDTLRFYNGLAPGEGHELVLFDVHRTQASESFLRPTSAVLLNSLPQREARGFDLSIVGNDPEFPGRVSVWDDVSQRAGAKRVALDLVWPRGVYSLSHVCLPFPLDDPIYGLTPGGDPSQQSLGNLNMRGERGVFVVSSGNLARLRSNPFFDYVSERMLKAVGQLVSEELPTGED